jgi:hypothetical protein
MLGRAATRLVEAAGEEDLLIGIRFPYRRWLLLIILNLSSTIAVRTVVTVTYPATAIATWANLHCQRLSC